MPTPVPTETRLEPLLELPILTNDAEYGLTTEQNLVLLELQRIYGISRYRPIARLEPRRHAFTTNHPVFSLRRPKYRVNDFILHVVDTF